MLAKLNILSTFGNPYYQPVESVIATEASGGYLINTENIGPVKVFGTINSIFDYKLNLNDDRSPEFKLKVDETKTAIIALADSSPESKMISLPVFLGALTFNDIETGDSTTDVMFNVKDIVWGNENPAENITRILVCEGGFAIHQYFVDYSIDAIIDVVTTGTTTTTTTSTSSTSTTSTSSTSTTSTSSTSTSSTSTSSTSSTSTSSTSTSSTSTSSTSTSSTSSTSTSSTSTSSTSSTSTSSTSTSSTSTTTIA